MIDLFLFAFQLLLLLLKSFYSRLLCWLAQRYVFQKGAQTACPLPSASTGKDTNNTWTEELQVLPELVSQLSSSMLLIIMQMVVKRVPTYREHESCRKGNCLPLKAISILKYIQVNWSCVCWGHKVSLHKWIEWNWTGLNKLTKSGEKLLVKSLMSAKMEPQAPSTQLSVLICIFACKMSHLIFYLLCTTRSAPTAAKNMLTLKWVRKAIRCRLHIMDW